MPPQDHALRSPGGSPAPSLLYSQQPVQGWNLPSEPPSSCSPSIIQAGGPACLMARNLSLIRKGRFLTPSTPAVWPGGLLRICSRAFRKGLWELWGVSGIPCPLLILWGPASSVRFPECKASPTYKWTVMLGTLGRMFSILYRGKRENNKRASALRLEQTSTYWHCGLCP